jgi:hypothetical protein
MINFVISNNKEKYTTSRIEIKSIIGVDKTPSTMLIGKNIVSNMGS